MALIISKKDLKKTIKLLEKNNEEYFIIGEIIQNIRSKKRCIIS